MWKITLKKGKGDDATVNTFYFDSNVFQFLRLHREATTIPDTEDEKESYTVIEPHSKELSPQEKEAFLKQVALELAKNDYLLPIFVTRIYDATPARHIGSRVYKVLKTQDGMCSIEPLCFTHDEEKFATPVNVTLETLPYDVTLSIDPPLSELPHIPVSAELAHIPAFNESVRAMHERAAEKQILKIKNELASIHFNSDNPPPLSALPSPQYTTVTRENYEDHLAEVESRLNLGPIVLKIIEESGNARVNRTFTQDRNVLGQLQGLRAVGARKSALEAQLRSTETVISLIHRAADREKAEFKKVFAQKAALVEAANQTKKEITNFFDEASRKLADNPERLKEFEFYKTKRLEVLDKEYSALEDSFNEEKKQAEELSSQKLKSLLKDTLAIFDFGNGVAQTKYVKEEILLTLFQVASQLQLTFWNDAETQKEGVDKKSYRQEKCKKLEEIFEGLLTINSMGEIHLVDPIRYQQLLNLPLSDFAAFVQGIGRKCDPKTSGMASSRAVLDSHLARLHAALQKELKEPKELKDPVFFTWEYSFFGEPSFKFTSHIHDDRINAEGIEKAISSTVEIALNKEIGGEDAAMAAQEVTSFIKDNEAEFLEFSTHYAAVKTNLEFFDRALTEKEKFSAVIKEFRDKIEDSIANKNLFVTMFKSQRKEDLKKNETIRHLANAATKLLADPTFSREYQDKIKEEQAKFAAQFDLLSGTPLLNEDHISSLAEVTKAAKSSLQAFYENNSIFNDIRRLTAQLAVINDILAIPAKCDKLKPVIIEDNLSTHAIADNIQSIENALASLAAIQHTLHKKVGDASAEESLTSTKKAIQEKLDAKKAEFEKLLIDQFTLGAQFHFDWVTQGSLQKFDSLPKFDEINSKNINKVDVIISDKIQSLEVALEAVLKLDAQLKEKLAPEESKEPDDLDELLDEMSEGLKAVDQAIAENDASLNKGEEQNPLPIESSPQEKFYAKKAELEALYAKVQQSQIESNVQFLAHTIVATLMNLPAWKKEARIFRRATVTDKNGKKHEVPTHIARLVTLVNHTDFEGWCNNPSQAAKLLAAIKNYASSAKPSEKGVQELFERLKKLTPEPDKAMIDSFMVLPQMPKTIPFQTTADLAQIKVAKKSGFFLFKKNVAIQPVVNLEEDVFAPIEPKPYVSKLPAQPVNAQPVVEEQPAPVQPQPPAAAVQPQQPALAVSAPIPIPNRKEEYPAAIQAEKKVRNKGRSSTSVDGMTEGARPSKSSTSVDGMTKGRPSKKGLFGKRRKAEIEEAPKEPLTESNVTEVSATPVEKEDNTPRSKYGSSGN